MNSSLLKDLNAEQQQAVTYGDGPLLLVSGAGTGKTTVITRRLAYLILVKHVPTTDILALTFTDKAAAEMEERVDKLMPYGYLDIAIGTFHAWCEKLLQDYGLEIGLPNNFKLLNTTEQWLLVRQNLAKFKLDYYRPLGNPIRFIHELIKHFSRLKDENITPEQYLAYAENLKLNADSADFIKELIDDETRASLTESELKELSTQEIKKVEEVANAYHLYQQLLLDNQALDFGDLITYSLRLLKARPKILAKLRKKYQYILVDEFQDTNLAQYDLIKLLATPRNNLTVCGDDDQSVYKFRGAAISNVLHFMDDFPAATKIFLTKNYRSAQNILDLAHAFIKQNDPNRLEYKLAQGKATPKKLTAQIKADGEILHLHAATAEQEVNAVLSKIAELKISDPSCNWSDFAILVRANDTASLFIYALEKNELPYQFVASRGLYSKPIILDILAYLKLLDNYHEGPALYRVLRWPQFNLSTAALMNLSYWSQRKSQSLYETLKQAAAVPQLPEEEIGEVNKLLALIEKHSQLTKTKAVSEVILTFLEDTGYLKELTRLENVKSVEAAAQLEQFYKKIRDWESAAAEKTVHNFLQLIEFELEAGEAGALKPSTQAGPEAIKVMTVHAAKGLEFKYVFIVSLVDRRFPASERSEAIEIPSSLVKEQLPVGDTHLEEERRLFYVAMTRAKQGLYLTSAQDYGGARAKKLSRFLNELEPLGLKLAPAKETAVANLENISVSAEDWSEFVPQKFSFTQLKAFEACPYQYRFAHLLRIPVKGKAVFSFGKTLHNTLQKFFVLVQERSSVVQPSLLGESQAVAGKIVTLEELQDLYEQSWQGDWFESPEQKVEYLAKGRSILKNFYQSLGEKFPVPLYLEYPFNLKISDGQDYTIKGVIDRVDEEAGQLVLIDYKTGTAKNPSKLTLEDKEQLLIYQIAAEEIFDRPVQKLYYYYLEGDLKAEFLGTAKELEKVKNKVIKTIEEIRRGKFLPTPGRICKFCDFKNICEFRVN
ncbi:MAG: UvrD-helicase domain-containing protein [Candidatus Buchananbacteria bacterium]